MGAPRKGTVERWGYHVSEEAGTVQFPFAFDTPGIIVPDTGPVGILVVELNPGDVILGDTLSGGTPSFISVIEAFDGNTPQAGIALLEDRGDLPGTSPSNLMTALFDLTSTDSDDTPNTTGTILTPASFTLLGNGPFVCRASTGLYLWIEDGSEADPESTQGKGELWLSIARGVA